jgi:hypothetical protein
MTNLCRFVLLVSVPSLVVSRVVPAQSLGAQLRGLLPRGRVTVEVLEMWSPPRLTVLTQRLQQAIQADPAWWQEHVRKGVPGEPLPYDAKLGLTEAEYRDFLALSDSVQMKTARTAEVVIESSQAGWRFGPASSIAALRNIEIDTVTNTVHSQFGDLGAADPITPSAEQRATGSWGGPRWNLEQVDTTTLTGTVAQFAVGKHTQTGRTIIYYDAKRMNRGQLSARESVFLRVLR